jgi:predicted metallopeptidase
MSTLNLTLELERLISDICRCMEEFAHIDPRRLLVCVSSTRGGGVHGTYAKIHPLCFTGGEKTKRATRGRRTYCCTMPTISHRGVEILYVIYFLVPRFFNLSVKEKLVTVFHELYHISPEFDGDIRRFPGKNYAHGSSTKRYNASMAQLVERYLQGLKDDAPVRFLDGDMDALRGRHRAVVGRKLAMPKIDISS